MALDSYLPLGDASTHAAGSGTEMTCMQRAVIACLLCYITKNSALPFMQCESMSNIVSMHCLKIASTFFSYTDSFVARGNHPR